MSERPPRTSSVGRERRLAHEPVRRLAHEIHDPFCTIGLDPGRDVHQDQRRGIDLVFAAGVQPDATPHRGADENRSFTPQRLDD